MSGPFFLQHPESESPAPNPNLAISLPGATYGGDVLPEQESQAGSRRDRRKKPLQDALLSAFKNMHQFRGEARFSTWLGSIALNSARMQLRRRLNHNLVSLVLEKQR